jgi:prophage tail gpP-like protein
MPKVTEIAELTVDGTRFTDWETVSVSLILRGMPPQQCRFTCSEGSPLVKNWYKTQIMPGSKCTVKLAGQLAFNGIVLSRQVFADAHRHRIEIQCANNLELATSSVITKTGEFKDQTPKQIIESVLKGVGKKLTVLGGQLPNVKIPRYSVTPGISIIDFIDTLTRHLGTMGTNIGIAHSATPEGDFAIVVGKFGGSDSIVEGQNMLEGREVIWIPAAAAGGLPSESSGNGSGGGGSGGGNTSQAIIGQAPGNDQKWGAQVAHVPFLSQAFQMMGQKLGPLATVAELPAFDKSITQGRVASEANWVQEDFVTVFGTIQGWLRPSGGLWVPGQEVIITSPMLVMKGVRLTLKTATFSQDDEKGTRTQLECCNANALNGQIPTESE